MCKKVKLVFESSSQGVSIVLSFDDDSLKFGFENYKRIEVHTSSVAGLLDDYQNNDVLLLPVKHNYMLTTIELTGLLNSVVLFFDAEHKMISFSNNSSTSSLGAFSVVSKASYVVIVKDANSELLKSLIASKNDSYGN